MSEPQPQFSVIIPVHNREALVSDAIQSVLDQTFTDFEILCINNGSTDGTAGVLEAFARNDSRVRTFDQVNKGRCGARNRGLDEARGNWICFLDSDDIYYPNHLEFFARCIEANPGQSAFASEMNHKGGIRSYPSAKFRGALTITFRDFLDHNPLSILQVCYDRAAISELRFLKTEDLPVAEDLLFLRELALLTDIKKMNEVTVEAIEHDQRTMRSSDASRIAQCNVRSAELFIERNNVSSTEQKRVLAYAHALAASIYLDLHHKPKALDHLRIATTATGLTHNKAVLRTWLKYLLKARKK